MRNYPQRKYTNKNLILIHQIFLITCGKQGHVMIKCSNNQNKDKIVRKIRKEAKSKKPIQFDKIMMSLHQVFYRGRMKKWIFI